MVAEFAMRFGVWGLRFKSLFVYILSSLREKREYINEESLRVRSVSRH